MKIRLLIAGGIAAILLVATGWAWVPQLIQAGDVAGRHAPSQKPASAVAVSRIADPAVRRRCRRRSSSPSISCRTSLRKRSRSS